MTDLELIFREINKSNEVVEYSEEPEQLKPFPNEHACRLADPGKFKRFRRRNNFLRVNGKSVDVIFGIRKSDNKSEIQSIRYGKEIWTASSARSNCSSRGGKFEAAG